MGAAIGWGALAASSLILGTLLAFLRPWPAQQVGAVLAFGAGALISSVSFDLAQEGVNIGGTGATAVGLGLGAIAYYSADGALGHRFSGGRGTRGRASGDSPGPALALGAFLDGIPEQFVLGVSIASGKGVSAALLVAIFISNLPESIGSASGMEQSGTDRGTILRVWLAVSLVCMLATVLGYAVADSASRDLRAGVDGFAAGALLVLLIDSMIPEARSQAGRAAGLITVLGFAVAAGMSTIS
jgi:zinc transporter, ZIP family